MQDVKQELLESCADMVLQCSDGRALPCIRFQCLTSCEVIQHLAQDVDLAKDDRGRVIVPFPNVPSADLAAAVAVIHSVCAIDALQADTAPVALRGLRALGHTSLTTRVVERLWTLVRDGELAGIRPHINELLHTTSIRLQVLRRLVVMCPTWPEFCAKVLAALQPDLAVAIWLLGVLPRFFAVGPLFVHLLDRLPTSVMNAQSAMRLFTEPCNASSYHPAEVTDMLRALARKFKAGGWDDVHLTFLRDVLTATQQYDVAPAIASSMHGSVILLERTPAASMLLTVGDRRAAYMSRRMAPWLTLQINRGTGVVDGRVTLDRLDEQGRYARSCQVRLTAYGPGDLCAELWRVYEGVLPMVPFGLVDAGEYGGGDVETFRGLVRSGDLVRLRVDVFYAETSVLEKAFF